MRTLVTWTCVILILCSGGLALSEALSLERWVNPSRLAAQPALAQETRPPASPVPWSRFARPVPVGWAGPSLVGARGRPGETWRPRLEQLGLPVAAPAPRLWVGPAGDTVPSVGRGAGARLGPPPLAASVMRVLASLPLPAAAAAPGYAVGSLEKTACAARAVPLPRVRLVKDVLAAMPDKCDDRIFGTWYCILDCSGWSCTSYGGEITLRRSIDPGGYERIHRRYEPYGVSDIDRSEWRVDRKWHPPVGNGPIEKGRLVSVSCNGKIKSGHAVLAVSMKSPDGSWRRTRSYYLDETNRFLWVQFYEVWWKGDKSYTKLLGQKTCRRESSY